MKPTVGRRIVVESPRVGRSPRTGSIEEILRPDPPRFRIRWDDGHTSIVSPESGAVQIQGQGAEDPEAEDFGDISQLCRSVNERIRDFEGVRVASYAFICECGDARCTEAMRLSPDEYETVRSDPTRFAILPGHEQDSDEVMSVNDRFVLVRRLTELAQRSGSTLPPGSARRRSS